MINKNEIFDFFIEKKLKFPQLTRNGIKKYSYELYDNILLFEKKYYCKMNIKYSELIYCYLKDIIITPKCKECGLNITKFKQFSFGYFNYCNTKCSSNSEVKRKKIEETCLKKYGHVNVAHGVEIKKLIKKTNIEKYGGHSSNNELVKEKTKKTNLNKYGVEYTFQSYIIKEKIKKSNLDRYGVEHVSQNKKIKDKILNTGIENGSFFKWNFYQLESLSEYRKAVRYYSNKNFRLFYYEINPQKLKRSHTTYHLDHIYPIIEGWINKIDPIDIAHKNNLQMLWCNDNTIKSSKTLMSLNEFYKLINKKIL